MAKTVEITRADRPNNQPAAAPSCKTLAQEQAECPQCARPMRLWASFYRCSNCGYKESCCF